MEWLSILPLWCQVSCILLLQNHPLRHLSSFLMWCGQCVHVSTLPTLGCHHWHLSNSVFASLSLPTDVQGKGARTPTPFGWPYPFICVSFAKSKVIKTQSAYSNLWSLCSDSFLFLKKHMFLSCNSSVLLVSNCRTFRYLQDQQANKKAPVVS